MHLPGQRSGDQPQAAEPKGPWWDRSDWVRASAEEHPGDWERCVPQLRPQQWRPKEPGTEPPSPSSFSSCTTPSSGTWHKTVAGAVGPGGGEKGNWNVSNVNTMQKHMTSISLLPLNSPPCSVWCWSNPLRWVCHCLWSLWHRSCRWCCWCHLWSSHGTVSHVGTAGQAAG